jgi:hypothetical protein
MTLLLLNAPYDKLRPGLLRAIADAAWVGLRHSGMPFLPNCRP